MRDGTMNDLPANEMMMAEGTAGRLNLGPGLDDRYARLPAAPPRHRPVGHRFTRRPSPPPLPPPPLLSLLPFSLPAACPAVLGGVAPLGPPAPAGRRKLTRSPPETWLSASEC